MILLELHNLFVKMVSFGLAAKLDLYICGSTLVHGAKELLAEEGGKRSEVLGKSAKSELLLFYEPL